MAGPGRHRGTGCLAAATDGATVGHVDYRILITSDAAGPDQWHVSLVPRDAASASFSEPDSYFLTLADGTVGRLHLTPALRNGRLTLCGNGYAATTGAVGTVGVRADG